MYLPNPEGKLDAAFDHNCIQFVRIKPIIMELGKDAMTKTTFYEEAKTYWEDIPPTVNGMLGGYGAISGADVKGSISFLKPMLMCEWNERVSSEKALDCGAGIGRVSKHLLLPLFQSVDLVEQEQKFLDEAPAFLGEAAANVGKYICCGLQDFVPQPKHYDVIWSQWVLGHLTDEHLVSFFRRCREGLKEAGVLCVKENIARDGVIFDEQDSSVTRSSEELSRIFRKAGLQILKEEVQRNFPLEIYMVKMFALR